MADSHLDINRFLDDALEKGRSFLRKRRMEFFDDFDYDADLADVEKWDIDNGTPSIVQVADRSVLQMTTGATGGNQANLGNDSADAVLPYSANNDPKVEFELLHDDADDTQVAYMHGLAGAMPAGSEAVPADFIGFVQLTAQSATEYACITSSSSSITKTDSGITLDTAFHRFTMDIRSDRVKFFIDGKLVATHTANIPSAALQRCLSAETLEAVAHNYQIDYFELSQDRA